MEGGILAIFKFFTSMFKTTTGTEKYVKPLLIKVVQYTKASWCCNFKVQYAFNYPQGKNDFQSGVILPIHRIIWFTELDQTLTRPATAVILVAPWRLQSKHFKISHL